MGLCLSHKMKIGSSTSQMSATDNGYLLLLERQSEMRKSEREDSTAETKMYYQGKKTDMVRTHLVNG